jgi:hypothetical protein
MTHRPVVDSRFREPFPVLVVEGEKAWVSMAEEPYRIPPPPPGASYLVPPEKAPRLEQYLREHDTVHQQSSWVLRVKPVSAGQQRIELFLMGDGYWGGVYDATRDTATPRYRKITGPGFAFIFGPVALLLNGAAWGAGYLAVSLVRRRKHAAQQPHEADPASRRAH